MIRNIGKTIWVNKYVSVEEIVTIEKIIEINIYPESKLIDIFIDSINESGVTVTSNKVLLNSENYDLLFSLADIFDEGKQKDSYREVDLWKVIDKAREENS